MLYKDINLIPYKRSGTRPARIVITALLVFTVLSYIGFYFVYDPLQEKADLQNRLDSLNRIITGYGNVATEYIEAREEYKRYTEKTSSLKAILKTEDTAMEEVKDFSDSCPEGVKIKSFNITDSSLKITCFADSYESIAAYITALEKIDYITEIKYSSIEYVKEHEELEGYNFSFTIKTKEK